MNRSKFQLCTVAVLILLCASVASAHTAIMCERATRERVIKKTMPRFPKEALDSGAQGVVIVAVLFDEDGNLSKFEVMQAPHPSIKQAVARALKKWKVRPISNRFGPRKTLGWLSFEYVIEEGVGHVGYTKRTSEDYQQDKRYIHPWSTEIEVSPIYYQYMFPPPDKLNRGF